MLRILLRGATMLSMLLCVATLVLWVRSYWHGDRIYGERTVKEAHVYRADMWGLRSGAGAIGVAWGSARRSDAGWTERAWKREYFAEAPRRPDAGADVSHARQNLRALGAQYAYWRHPPRNPALSPEPREEVRGILLPYWMPASAFALLPGVAAVRGTLNRRRRRRTSGLCSMCGYDLRATPDRCPECGRDIA